MTEGKRVAPLAFIQENLWAILAGIGAAYSGYLTGMTTMDARISALEKQTTKIERKIDELSPRVERIDAMLLLQAELAKEQRLKEHRK